MAIRKLLLSLIFLIFISLNSFGQYQDNTIIGYYVTAKGDNVKMYHKKPEKKEASILGDDEDFALSTECFYYRDNHGKTIKVKQKKVADLYIGQNHYTRLKTGTTFGFKRLHQVLITNHNYILTEYFSHGAFYYYLYSKQKEEFVYKKKKSANKTKKDIKFAEKYFRPYFGDCTNFISQLDKNLSKQYKPDYSISAITSYMTIGISNMKCE